LSGTFSIPRTLPQTHNTRLIPRLIHSFTHATFAATATVSSAASITSTFVAPLEKQPNNRVRLLLALCSFPLLLSLSAIQLGRGK